MQPPRREVGYDRNDAAARKRGGPVPLIQLESVSYTYEDSSIPAILEASLSIEKGEYVAVIGGNGSGKSTLVRLFNGLRSPQSGIVRVSGLDPSDNRNRFAARSAVALVFQSPADQIVSSCVEEDVAFGPENLGLPRTEIARRVEVALETAGLSDLRSRPTRNLSGGQLQKLAIAGALAMEPACIIFDEATSMLDPGTKAAVLELMDSLSAEGVAVVHVTHDLDDAAKAGRIIALEAGKIVYDGAADVFFGLRGGAPATTLIPTDPRADFPARSLGFELPSALKAAALLQSGTAESPRVDASRPSGTVRAAGLGSVAFSFRHVSFSYLGGTSTEQRALEDVSFELPAGSKIAFVGATGSGKSTALQLCNAIYRPSSGKVSSLGIDTSLSSADPRSVRIRAPLSIQRPESALFEPYAADDVAFGPRNLGLSGEALVARVSAWMDRAGVPYMTYRDRLSRRLSGGEKRKLALAGVFAMESEAVLLDEPTSALDPPSRRAVFELVESLAGRGVTVVFATHSMDEAALADFVAVFSKGKLAAFGSPDRVFLDEYSSEWNIGLPAGAALATLLRKSGVTVKGRPLTIGQVAAAIPPAERSRAAGLLSGMVGL